MARKTKTKATKASKAAKPKKKAHLKSTNGSITSPPPPSKPPVFPPNSAGIRYWLIKTEPVNRIDKQGNDVKFSIADLAAVPKEPWTGVRNYEACASLIHMAQGDICLVYHSNCKNPGIVGVSSVVSESAKPDKLQFDSKSGYYDAKATQDVPRWWCPDVKFEGLLHRKVTLAELKQNDEFKEMYLVKRGRLSVTPLSEEHYKRILEISKEGEVGEDEFDCKVDKLPTIEYE